MIDLSEITEGTIIRDLQPNDLIVLTVPEARLTAQFAHELKAQAEAHLGCKVLIKSESVTLDLHREGDEG